MRRAPRAVNPSKALHHTFGKMEEWPFLPVPHYVNHLRRRRSYQTRAAPRQPGRNRLPITNAVQDNTYRLVVPEPVLNAFNREKQNAAESYWKTQRETIKKLRQLRQAFSFAEEISTFADRLTKELDAHTSDVRRPSKPRRRSCRKENLFRSPTQ